MVPVSVPKVNTLPQAHVWRSLKHSSIRRDFSVTHFHLPVVRVTFDAVTNGKDSMIKLPFARCCGHTSLHSATWLAPSTAQRIDNPPVSCSSMLGLGKGFVIKSAGFTCEPPFFMTNFSDLDASCTHKCCTFTCFALPKPRRLTKHIVADASSCSFSLHTPSPSSEFPVLPMWS